MVTQSAESLGTVTATKRLPFGKRHRILLMVSRALPVLAMVFLAGLTSFDVSEASLVAQPESEPIRLSAGPTQKKLDELLVYGAGFIFSVKEPFGWAGDTETAAQFDANLLLHETNKPRESTSRLIRIRVNDKVDENTNADMEADMRDYRTQYPKVRFKDLPTKTARYLCLARVFYVPGEFYEYVAYINPGPKKPILLSVSMNTGKSEASAAELAAYESVLQSLTLLKP